MRRRIVTVLSVIAGIIPYFTLSQQQSLTSGGDIQVAASLRPPLAMGRSYALAGDRPGMFPPVTTVQPARSSIGESSNGGLAHPAPNTKRVTHIDGVFHIFAAQNTVERD